MTDPKTPSPRGKRGRPRASFRRALLQLLVAGIVVPAALIWGIGQFTSQAAVTTLWNALSHRIAGYAIQKTLRYLETGPTALRYNASLLERGEIDIADRRGMLAWLLTGLNANPHVTWYSFAGPDGAYLSAYRPPEGGIRLTWREQEEGGARYRDFRVAEDGTWTALPEKVQPYDPRTRTWYEEAVAAGGPVWSKPFLFASGPPGFILSDAAREKGGQVLGVWGIEYEMAYVSKFLARLEVARHGRAYLVTRAGEVIGHPLAGEEGGDPDDWLAVVEDGKKRIASAQGHRDPWLRAGWRNCKGFCEGERHGRFDLDGETYLTGAKPFPPETGLPWGILIVIPEEDILGEIHRNYLYAALLAALIAGLVIAFGFVYARRRLSDPLTDIAHDLDRLAQLEIDAEPLVREGRLAEVEGMVQARDRVRGGLRSFMKYVPADLVRQLFEAKAQARLGVEECRLTILFSDVADFTSISERLGDPRALVDALESYFEAMSATIAEYGGTVDKYIGDAVMAFWGAPRPLPEHERLALEAAWACQERLGALRAKWEAEGKPPFHTRIGVNTGPAVVGNIGWAQRMNYTAMGDAVNVASRLEGFCKIYGIRIAVSEETYRAGGEGFLARPVDYVSVKGREAPILVYDLLGRKDAASEKTHRFARTIERAFEAYRSRRFAEARALFDEALELRPGDRPAERLRERAAAYEKEPPPEDWAGAVHLDRKS